MLKIVFILAVGFAAGYSFGWKDAQQNSEDVVTRIVERVGGSAREKYKTDVDAQMERLEKR